MENFPVSHNSYCSLEIPKRRKFKVFVSMIKGLRSGPLSYAISANPKIHYSWVKQFWENARTNEESSTITSRIDNVEVIVTEEVVRKALKIGDKADYLCTDFSEEQLTDYLNAIGYEEEGTSCEKKHLPDYWKLLFHIVAHCLSAQKGGFNRINSDWVELMLSLTWRKEYNFSRLFFVYLQSNTSVNKRKMIYPRFIQLILDHLLPDTPKPSKTDKVDKDGNKTKFIEPFHVKRVRDGAMSVILNPIGKTFYMYKGEQPGPKIGQFAETESDTDEAVGNDDDDPDDDQDDRDDSDKEEQVDEPIDDSDRLEGEHRSKHKHDKKKKGKVGESSKRPATETEEEEESDRPLKRVKKTKEPKKSLSSKLPPLKVTFPLTSEMVSRSLVTQTKAPQTTLPDPHIGSPRTLAKTLKTLQDKQIKITKTTTKVSSPKAPIKPRTKLIIRKKPAPQKPSLVDHPITPPEASSARLDEPMPSIFEDIPLTTQTETSTTPRTTSPTYQFTSPIKDSSFWISTFTTSNLTQTTSTTIETTTTPTSLPLATTTPFPTITMPVPTTQQTTIATVPP